MNQRIDNTGPSVGHTGPSVDNNAVDNNPVDNNAEVGASSRLNPAAAFRALLGLRRPSGGPLPDKSTRRGSSRAGGAPGGDGSYAETDDAVEAASSNEGDGDNDWQRQERDGRVATSEDAVPASSSFLTTMAPRDAAPPSPAAQPIATASPPHVWPAAALPGAWRRVGHPASAYVPSSASVDRTSARARRRKFYTSWNPSWAAMLSCLGPSADAAVPYPLYPTPCLWRLPRPGSGQSGTVPSRHCDTPLRGRRRQHRRRFDLPARSALLPFDLSCRLALSPRHRSSG
jgi:hypothetical protein